MGGDEGARMQFTLDIGFNPRPHMGGDLHIDDFILVVKVSIHAPTWGATRLGAY